MIWTLLRALAFLAAIQAFAPVSVRAADQTILGKQIQIKDPKPSDPTKRKLVGRGKEPGSLGTIVGEPTVYGAMLSIFANGTVSSKQSFLLPPTLWSVTGTKGFRYRDPTGSVGAARSVSISKTGSGTFQIKAQVQAKYGPLAIVPPNQGTDSCMLLEIGNGDSYHVRLGSGGIIKKNNSSSFLIRDEMTEGRCRCTETPAGGIANGDFECGDMAGWTVSGAGGVPGTAWIVEESTCWSGLETRGIALSGDFSANVRSLGVGNAVFTSVGILTSDPFTAAAAVTFDALSENFDGSGTSNPVAFSVNLLSEDGSTVLATESVTTAIVTLPSFAFPCGTSSDLRTAVFSHHQVDTSAFLGQQVRIEFRQHSNVFNDGLFTLVDNVAVQ